MCFLLCTYMSFPLLNIILSSLQWFLHSVPQCSHELVFSALKLHKMKQRHRRKNWFVGQTARMCSSFREDAKQLTRPFNYILKSHWWLARAEQIPRALPCPTHSEVGLGAQGLQVSASRCQEKYFEPSTSAVVKIDERESVVLVLLNNLLTKSFTKAGKWNGKKWKKWIWIRGG